MGEKKSSGGSAVERLSPVENSILGIVCGSIEVSVNQPTIYLKNASQQGLPLTMSPSVLYRGLGVSIANMGIATGLQFPLTGLSTGLLKRGEQRKLTNAEQILAGLMGGAMSGSVCASMELSMIQQQKTGSSLLQTIKTIVKETGPLGMFRGLLMTSGREGLYTAGYLGVGPVMGGILRDDYGFSTASSKIGGAICGGVFASTASHPLDTVKTCMQGDLMGTTYKTVSSTFKTLYEEGGLPRFCRGWTWRTGRMISAVFILSETQSLLAPVLFSSKFA